MVKDVLIGIIAYFRHLSLVRKNGLGRFFFAPILIGVLMVATIGTSAYGLSDNLGSMMSDWYPWERGAGFVQSFSAVIAGIFIFVFGLIIVKYIILILASPFMSPMSQRIEAQGNYNMALRYHSLSSAEGIWRGIRIASGNIIKELSVTVILLLLSLILPILSPFTAILIFLVQAYYAGSGNMDYTLERYFDVKNSKRFIRENRGLAIGNGIIFVALMMLGLGFFIAPPLGTLAVTPEVLKRLEKY